MFTPKHWKASYPQLVYLDTEGSYYAAYMVHPTMTGCGTGLAACVDLWQGLPRL